MVQFNMNESTLGLYFSGTGNTRHCVTEFVHCLGKNSVTISIESSDVASMFSKHNFIVFGYPIYFRNTPKIVKDFIKDNKDNFKGKKVFIICTMGLFSGDGAGCGARIFKKCGAKIVGGLHLKMPDCIGDVKLLKKSVEGNRELIEQANKKIYDAVQKLQNGKPTKNGLKFFQHIGGLFGQRLWFYRKTTSYKNKPIINNEKCIGCGVCAKTCPLGNLEIKDGKATSKGKCTLCYRCFSNCPTQALTILGKQVHEQCYFEKYQNEA